jgi:hypothetical protein
MKNAKIAAAAVALSVIRLALFINYVLPSISGPKYNETWFNQMFQEGKRYDQISEIINVNGTLAYVAYYDCSTHHAPSCFTEPNHNLIVYGEKELGKDTIPLTFRRRSMENWLI